MLKIKILNLLAFRILYLWETILYRFVQNYLVFQVRSKPWNSPLSGMNLKIIFLIYQYTELIYRINQIFSTQTLTLLKFEENGSHSIKTLVIGNWKCHWLWAHQQKTSANFHNSIKINLLNFGVSIEFWSEVLRTSEKQLLSQFNSNSGGMAVALPLCFEVDFMRNPFSGSASWFFVIIL